MAHWWDLIKGTSGSNEITGTSSDDIILGLKGADTIFGGAGDDLLIGGAGDDTLYGGIGDDTLIGGSGNDVLFGEEGHDLLLGGSGSDTLVGGSGSDFIHGGSGDDIIRGGSGSDIIGAAGGNDHVVHNVDDNVGFWDYANGGGGFDTLTLEVSLAQFNAINDSGIPEGFAAVAGTGDLFDFGDYNLGFDFDLFVRNFEVLGFDIINSDPDAVDDVASAFEDAPMNIIMGDVFANDIDTDIPAGDFLTVTAVDGVESDVGATIAGTYGEFVLSGDGSYEYVVDNSNADVDALNIGGTLVETFDYTVADSFGAVDTATLSITINGSNDAPTAAVLNHQAVSEDAVVDSDGNAVVYTVAIADLIQSVEDVDDMSGFDLVNFTAPPGLTLNKVGTDLEITVNNPAALDALNVDPDNPGAVFEITADVKDPHGGILVGETFNFSVSGVNDAPTAIALDNASVVENIEGAVVGILSTSDVDAMDTHTYEVSDDRFEVVDGVLKLKEGVSLDFVVTDSGGDDTVVGGDGTDTIGGDDTDTIGGGDGTDVVVGGDGTDTVVGGDGTDTIGGDDGT